MGHLGEEACQPELINLSLPFSELAPVGSSVVETEEIEAIEESSKEDLLVMAPSHL